jgi:glycerophosphoryl diester phosphodiesterase
VRDILLLVADHGEAAAQPAGVAFLDAPLPLAFAHRGGAATGDENTLDAFRRAVELGYRYLETDTHATADGVAVVFHDSTLDRMLGRPGRIGALRWKDIASLRIGGSAAVPRLDDLLGGWPQVRFNIDVKSDAAVEATLAAVRRTAAMDRVLLASFSDARLARMRHALGPAVATSLGTREALRVWSASRLAGPGRPGTSPRTRPGRRRPRLADGVVAAQVPLRRGRLRVVDRRFVAHAHRLGLQVHVWTIDDRAEMHELLDLGVDGIMTDRIDILREVYRDRGHWIG